MLTLIPAAKLSTYVYKLEKKGKIAEKDIAPIFAVLESNPLLFTIRVHGIDS